MTVAQGLGETRRLSRRPLSKRRTPVASSRTRTIAPCPASLDEMRLKTKSDFNLTRLQANTYLVDTRCVSSVPRSSGEVHCGAKDVILRYASGLFPTAEESPKLTRRAVPYSSKSMLPCQMEKTQYYIPNLTRSIKIAVNDREEIKSVHYSRVVP